MKESQYRVGREGWRGRAASTVSKSEEPMRKASAPRLAAWGESVRVDRKRAIAATPSSETVMKPMAATERQAPCAGLRAEPERLIIAVESGALPSRSRPTT